MNIADIRKEYKLQTLSEHEVAAEPIAQFDHWWDDAIKSKLEEVNAMTLATASATGIPAARIVLLKGYDKNGFVFFTNYQSHKGKEIEENPNACLVFFWAPLERQVRITGRIEKVSAEESNDYFESRPAGSRIGAWASPQSTVIANRAVIEENIKDLEEKFIDGHIPRPPHWGGYIVQPQTVEFWQGRPSRLHDRILYTKNQDATWKIERLAP
ncbi:MAG: pyridoxamine 5'-phosphate oxidase [Bacteroidetes bacterium]|nr:pyridoxamine 5'-phosphate oxidase [Bacteroidota bacterium]